MRERKFNFSLTILIRHGDVLYRALIDPIFGAPLAERLNEAADTPVNNFATRFKLKLDALGAGQVDHTGKRGELSNLTLEQAAALRKMGRVCSMARRSAKLAFRGEKGRLHLEFQVGISEPKTPDAFLNRSRIVLAACERYATELKAHGWTARDTQKLKAAIDAFDGVGLAQGDAKSDRSGLSSDKSRAANEVYIDALKIQNAANLEYPLGEPGVESARSRFLLDEFPPRVRSTPAAEKPAPDAPAPAVASAKRVKARSKAASPAGVPSESSAVAAATIVPPAPVANKSALEFHAPPPDLPLTAISAPADSGTVEPSVTLAAPLVGAPEPAPSPATNTGTDRIAFKKNGKSPGREKKKSKA